MRDLYHVTDIDGHCMLTGIEGLVIEPNVDDRYAKDELERWAARFNALYVQILNALDPVDAMKLRYDLNAPEPRRAAG